jgi:hypothetical protein
MQGLPLPQALPGTKIAGFYVKNGSTRPCKDVSPHVRLIFLHKYPKYNGMDGIKRGTTSEYYIGRGWGALLLKIERRIRKIRVDASLPDPPKWIMDQGGSGLCAGGHVCHFDGTRAQCPSGVGFGFFGLDSVLDCHVVKFF